MFLFKHTLKSIACPFFLSKTDNWDIVLYFPYQPRPDTTQRGRTMTTKRTFKDNKQKTINEVFSDLVRENIDDLKKNLYDPNKVNTATSHNTERKDKNEM
jgi:cytochrome c